MRTTKQRIFIDQFDRIHRVYTIKELKDRVGRTKAYKMYRDTKSGTKHIGYVVGDYWLTEYQTVEKTLTKDKT